MSEFTELIKSFDKIREYMRDFYIYGFKRRDEFTYKSSRTYDNERRRIASWLADHVSWDYSTKGKRVFLSVNSGRVPQNPLYKAWKSKSFTKNDIMLHFFLLACLNERTACGVEELTEHASQYCRQPFDIQTVRGKLREYEQQGIVRKQKAGKKLLYSMAEESVVGNPAYAYLLDAIKFYQEVAPFGFVGSTVLDRERIGNDMYYFKHHFIVHTLDDGILAELLRAMEQRRVVLLENSSVRTGRISMLTGIPLRILTGTQTGRRYVCIYDIEHRRFRCVRLDYLTKVFMIDSRAETSMRISDIGAIGDEIIARNEVAVADEASARNEVAARNEGIPDYEILQQKLDKALSMTWGVSFSGAQRQETLAITLAIDEQRERYLIDRVRREGRGGTLQKVGEDRFLYTITTYDTNEMLPWIRTFTGRICHIEGSNAAVVTTLRRDLQKMYQMYGVGADR